MGLDRGRPAFSNDGGQQPMANRQFIGRLRRLSVNTTETGLPEQMPLAAEFSND